MLNSTEFTEFPDFSLPDVNSVIVVVYITFHNNDLSLTFLNTHIYSLQDNESNTHINSLKTNVIYFQQVLFDDQRVRQRFLTGGSTIYMFR